MTDSTDDLGLGTPPPPVPKDPDCDEAESNIKTSGPSNPTPRRDKYFYQELVTFQVGNTLFKVAKSGFQVPGTIFEAMFALPTSGNSSSIEGSSDDNPIYLHGINEGKFRAFLTMLYPSTATADEEGQYLTLIGALELATFWEFTKLRNEIISTLSPTIDSRSNLEVIFIAKKYRVADWLRAAYQKLVRSCAQLPMEELSSEKFPLDWETIAKIYHIRDTIARGAINNTTCSKCGQSYGPSCGQPHDPIRFSCECRAVQVINTEFNKELESMEDASPGFFETPMLLSGEIPAGTARTAMTEGSGGKKKKKF